MREDLILDDDTVRTAVLPRPATITFALLTALVVALVIGAMVAEVDRIVVAPGKTISSAPNLVIQPLNRSIVKEIKVKVGQTVTRGEPLITLDPTFAEADTGKSREKLHSLAAELARLRAELDGQTFPPPGAVSPEMALQAQVMESRRREYASRMQSYTEKINATRAEIVRTEAEARGLAERQLVLGDIEKMYKDLFAKEGVGSRLNWLKSQNERLAVDGQLTTAREKLKSLAHELGTAQAEREAFEREWRNKTFDQLVKVERDHNDVQQELRKAELQSQLVVLSAPVDAVVLEIADISVGSVVREAETVVRLVPLNVPVEVEAEVSSIDVAHVEPGQPVRIKLDSLPYQRHGVLDGVVKTVSSDSFKHEDNRQNDQPYYAMRVEITGMDMRSVPSTFRLVPGMSLQAEVKVGTRPVIEYIIYPIIRGLDQSIREP